jgi:RNA recognition motif-containing protein
MANEKNTIYVGGLADDVNDKLLNDIFIVFGDISEIQVSNAFVVEFCYFILFISQ